MSNWRIFTDGACLGNPGPGGWAAIIRSEEGRVTELGGAESKTTNNRMELRAVIEGLRFLLSRDKMQAGRSAIELCLDSKYVEDGAKEYLGRWIQNGFLTQSREPVKNQDLWKEFYSLYDAIRDRVVWVHIEGHSGIPGNERADQIAQECALGRNPSLFRDFPGSEYPWNLDEIAADRSGDSAFPQYLCLLDGQIQVYGTWEECQKAVLGRSGVKFKKVKNLGEKRMVLKDWGFSG